MKSWIVSLRICNLFGGLVERHIFFFMLLYLQIFFFELVCMAINICRKKKNSFFLQWTNIKIWKFFVTFYRNNRQSVSVVVSVLVIELWKWFFFFLLIRLGVESKGIFMTILSVNKKKKKIQTSGVKISQLFTVSLWSVNFFVGYISNSELLFHQCCLMYPFVPCFFSHRGEIFFFRVYKLKLCNWYMFACANTNNTVDAMICCIFQQNAWDCLPYIGSVVWKSTEWFNCQTVVCPLIIPVRKFNTVRYKNILF